MNSLKKIFDRDTWDEIFESISKNKTRTIITTIGVFWGIFIYIALAGSATGIQNGFDEAFSGMSKNSMGVWAQSTSIPYKLRNFFMNSTFVLKFKTIQTIHYVLANCYAIISIRLPKAIKFIVV